MPTLKLFNAAGAPRAHLVHKPVTTLGRGLGNDVALKGPGVAEHHAQIVFDGRDFLLEEVDRDGEMAINGKKKRRARLVHGDRLQLGGVEVSFSMFAEPILAVRGDDDEGGGESPGARSISAELA